MLHRWRCCCGHPGRRGIFNYIPKSCELSHSIYTPQFCQPWRLAPLGRKAISTAAPSQIESSRQRRKDTLPTADTIYALSTAAGRAAIAVIRISGPACLDIYGALCPDKSFPHPRIATLRRLVDPRDNTRIIDTAALVLYFSAPKTVTGEDMLELHVHGGPAIVRSVLQAIPTCVESRPRRRTADYSLIRAAEPGEFTKRSFYNGRLDLTQAEALGETLAAETEQQRRLAVAGVNGGLAVRYEAWRKALLHARGELEALIDFSEDQHFDESPAKFMLSISAQIDKLSKQIQLHIQNATRGELLRNGISVALLGAPNAGKSSLLNQIVGREAAIVSSEAGTTRDIVDVSVDINGWLVKLGDMAGLREDSNDCRMSHVEPRLHDYVIGQVEREGIRRARERALQADLVIVLFSLFQQQDGAIELSINQELIDAVKACQAIGKAMLFVINKIDLLPPHNRTQTENGLRQRISNMFPSSFETNVFLISCKDAASSLSPTFDPKSISKMSDPGGVQTLMTGLSHAFTNMTSATTDSDPSLVSIIDSLTPAEAQSYWAASLSVTHRQSMYLQQCRTHLEDFLAQSSPSFASTVTSSSHHVDGHADLVGERGQIREEDEDREVDIVTAAEHLRYAAACLAKITGRGEGGDVEDVLGVVFEK